METRHLETLEDKGLIRIASIEPELEYLFRHALVHDATYHSILRHDRKRLHRSVAEALKLIHTDRLDEIAPILARHYQLGELWESAFTYLHQAALRARSMFALNESIEFLSQALAIASQYPEAADRGSVLPLLELRGEARGLVGDFHGAVDDLQRALDAAQQAEDTPRELDLLARLGQIYRHYDHLDDATSILRDALDVSRAINDQVRTADILYVLGTVAWSRGDNVRAGDYQREAVEISRALSLRTVIAVQALHGMAESSWLAGEAEQAVALYEESLTLARELRDKSYETENLQMMGVALLGIDYERSQRLETEAIQIARESHLDVHAAAAWITRGSATGFTGDYENGLAYLENGILTAESAGALRIVVAGLIWKGHLLQDLNLLDRAQEVLDKAQVIAVENDIGFMNGYLTARLAIGKLRRGDLSAGDDLRASLGQATMDGQHIHARHALEGLIELALAWGDLDQATQYIEKLRDLAEPRGLAETLVQVHRWRGAVLLARNALEEAESDLLRAASNADEIGCVRLMWDIHALLMEAYQRQGRADEAAVQKKIVRNLISELRDNLQDPALRIGLPDL